MKTVYLYCSKCGYATPHEKGICNVCFGQNWLTKFVRRYKWVGLGVVALYILSLFSCTPQQHISKTAWVCMNVKEEAKVYHTFVNISGTKGKVIPSDSVRCSVYDTVSIKGKYITVYKR